MWTPVNAPMAPLSQGDVTRRWALEGPEGSVFPGLTRGEADAYAEAFDAHPPADDSLVRVTLDALLSDGAGPHLVDADGQLVLVLGPHPHVDGVHVCMAQGQGGAYVVGAVSPRSRDVWVWRVRADIAMGDHVAALDGIADARDDAGLRAWAVAYGGRTTRADA